MLKITLLAAFVGVVAGCAVALFLWSLDGVTSLRLMHPWLLYFLPAAGVLIYFLYRFYGKDSVKGNNLIIERIHQPGGGVTWAMAPLVLSSTLITHLFGGSAGREGTAVQMAGSLAGFISSKLRLSPDEMKSLLMAGIAAGFAAVFGTPFTAIVFAFEVLRPGRIRYEAIIPVLAAAFVADQVCLAWGIHHTSYEVYHRIAWLGFDEPLLLLKAAFAGIAFGLAARLFVAADHTVKRTLAFVRIEWLRPVIGGVLVIVLSQVLQTDDYLGLGVSGSAQVSIVHAFRPGGAEMLSWFWKLLFTAITLGSGFKGGEVTPLFFIGATLGNVIAVFAGAPVDLFAALGFVAVFAGATNAPIACVIMGMELFGANGFVFYLVACICAYFFSGRTGIYTAQGPRRKLF